MKIRNTVQHCWENEHTRTPGSTDSMNTTLKSPTNLWVCLLLQTICLPSTSHFSHRLKLDTSAFHTHHFTDSWQEYGGSMSLSNGDYVYGYILSEMDTGQPVCRLDMWRGWGWGLNEVCCMQSLSLSNSLAQLIIAVPTANKHIHPTSAGR